MSDTMAMMEEGPCYAGLRETTQARVGRAALWTLSVVAAVASCTALVVSYHAKSQVASLVEQGSQDVSTMLEESSIGLQSTWVHWDGACMCGAKACTNKVMHNIPVDRASTLEKKSWCVAKCGPVGVNAVMLMKVGGQARCYCVTGEVTGAQLGNSAPDAMCYIKTAA